VQLLIYCKVLAIQALLAKVIKFVFLSEVSPHYLLDSLANFRLPGVDIRLLKGQTDIGFYGNVEVFFLAPLERKL